MEWLSGLIKCGLKTVANAATGGLAGEILGVIENLLPDTLSAEDKAKLQLSLERLAMQREAAVNAAALEAERSVTERASVLEGTAKDLLSLPVVGRLILFLRGAQRPVWGFAVLYIDVMVFSKTWPLTPDSLEETAFVAINFLVLGFLFGERAVKNLMPMILPMIGKGGSRG